MIISVTAYKGGVGKTTTAVHLAAYLARQDRTLLVDGDPNRSALLWANGGKLPFDVLSQADSQGRVREYEHVLIDTEARPNDRDLQALAKGSDLVLVPAQPSAMALRGLLMTFKALGDATNVRALLTLVPPAPSLAARSARQTLSKAEVPTCAAQIRRAAAFERAALEGVTVDRMDARARVAWTDYERLGKEVLGI